MSGPMDMIFGVLSDTNMQLLKHNFAFFPQNIKCQKLLKTQRPLTKKQAMLRPPNYMYLIELYKRFSEWP